MDINDNMLSSAKHPVDDSVTVKFFSIAALLFLPANFVAVSFLLCNQFFTTNKTKDSFWDEPVFFSEPSFSGRL